MSLWSSLRAVSTAPSYQPAPWVISLPAQCVAANVRSVPTSAVSGHSRRMRQLHSLLGCFIHRLAALQLIGRRASGYPSLSWCHKGSGWRCRRRSRWDWLGVDGSSDDECSSALHLRSRSMLFRVGCDVRWSAPRPQRWPHRYRHASRRVCAAWSARLWNERRSRSWGSTIPMWPRHCLWSVSCLLHGAGAAWFMWLVV